MARLQLLPVRRENTESVCRREEVGQYRGDAIIWSNLEAAREAR